MEGKIAGRAVGCLMDTGATVNILSLSWWRQNGEPGSLMITSETVYSVEGRPMRLHGKVEVPLKISKWVWTVPFELAEIATDAILGTKFLGLGRGVH